MIMRKMGLILLTLLLFIISGCSSSTTTTGVNTPIPISDLLANNGQKYPVTPTPFQPLLSVNHLDVTSTGEPAVIPTPTETGIISLGLERPEGQINILLFGSDWRPGQGYRTDVIMLLSLIPDEGIATLTSFPRDLYVDIPGIGYERINAAQAYGGFALTQETFEYNFDAPVDYYMMTNFSGFESIIDTLGGITVNAAYELYDRCDLPQAVNKMCYVPAGQTTMDGATALWYVRSRYSTDDFDRTRRAQEVILAIIKKTMSLDALNRAAELYDLFQYSVETDIPLDIIIKLLPIASDIAQNPSIIQQYAITESDITHYVVPVTGAMVLIPHNEAVANIIRKAIYP